MIFLVPVLRVMNIDKHGRKFHKTKDFTELFLMKKSVYIKFTHFVADLAIVCLILHAKILPKCCYHNKQTKVLLQTRKY